VAGVEITVQLFCARLAYSTRDVVHAYLRQDRSAWLDGQVQAFNTWVGRRPAAGMTTRALWAASTRAPSTPATSSWRCRAPSAFAPTTAPRARPMRRDLSRAWSGMHAATT
jgi:hypothetical protein